VAEGGAGALMPRTTSRRLQEQLRRGSILVRFSATELYLSDTLSSRDTATASEHHYGTARLELPPADKVCQYNLLMSAL